MYEEIKQIIKNKKSDIDDETLTYFTNYFYVAKKRGVIPKKQELESLIDNALMYKIVFFEEDSEIAKEKGKDFKGVTITEEKTIYIRKKLPDDLKEIMFYHEFHHAVQTNPLNNKIGINQVSNIGRLIMEAQTQYFAEVVYEEIHGVKFQEREIPSELNNLRMLPGGTVVSKVHNYEMIDCMLSKLAIILDVDKDFFVKINYLGANDEGLNILRKKYEEVKEKYGFLYDFETMLFNLDYIYCVYLRAYIDNSDKEIILNGGRTKNRYEIWPGKQLLPLSLEIQKMFIDGFDKAFFDCLANADGNCLDFAKYIIDNQNRKKANDYLEGMGAKNK